MLGHSTPVVTANIYIALKDNNARACGVLADVYAGEENKNGGWKVDEIYNSNEVKRQKKNRST